MLNHQLLKNQTPCRDNRDHLLMVDNAPQGMKAFNPKVATSRYIDCGIRFDQPLTHVYESEYRTNARRGVCSLTSVMYDINELTSAIRCILDGWMNV